MQILTVNAGSSSVRLALFATVGNGVARLRSARHPVVDADAAVLTDVLPSVAARPPIVAHHIVHGGRRLSATCRVDADAEKEIERLAPLAPLHNPAALRWIEAARAAYGEQVEQIAVFDTAWYATLPEVAATYALPRDLARNRELRRYGFHGIAHRALWERWRSRAGANAGGRVISFQLGAGSSVTAIRDGQAQDTSMGFSPLEGLVMATRPGNVDPGLILYLQTGLGLAPANVERMLNRESGLLGVSGLSGDMRELLKSTEPAARLAVDLYCYRARKYLGAYLAVLGGADAILFGGGIGENSPEIRSRILHGMEFAGIVLSERANARTVGTEERISAVRSRVAVHVVPVDEETLLAEEALQVLLQRGEPRLQLPVG